MEKMPLWAFFSPVWLLTAWVGTAITVVALFLPMPPRPRIPFALDLGADPWMQFRALQQMIPSSVFAGRTAAWLLGMRHVDPLDPIEVILPMRSGMRSRRGITVRR